MPGPATDANRARNGRGRRERRARWTPARDALWGTLDPLVAVGARIAVVGAGNGDDLPLGRLAGRAGTVVLLDLDPGAPATARRRLSRGVRWRVEVVEHDVTGGAADAITAAAQRDHPPRITAAPADPLPGAPYDLVVGDLLYSQLLYPALADLGIPDARLRATLARHGAALTRGVVARLHASAPAGTVVHVHDPVGWWAGHGQPIPIEAVLAASSPEAGLRIAARCSGPREADPRTALAALGVPIAATALWRWPFTDGVDYLACATVAGVSPAVPR